MCLSTVYRGNAANPENKIAEYVTRIDTEEDGSIILTDITGNELAFTGALKRIDLISNNIFVQIN